MTFLDATVIGLMILAMISIVVTTLRVGISPMPSSGKACQAIIGAIPKDTAGTIVDLGSGWGNIVFRLAHSFPNATIYGIELSLVPWLVSRLGLLLSPHPKLSLKRTDFRRHNLGDADVVICYLFPGAMDFLKEKFARELKPGALIVSNTFRLAGWVPESITTLDDAHKTPIYLYRVPTC